MDGNHEPRFAGDAMLGGLARWLHATGYDACWRAGVDYRDLVRLSQAGERTLLTCDGGIFRFAVVRDGVLTALRVPNGLTTQEQRAFVLGNLGLPLREPRCMACGGELLETPKGQVKDRVPPRSLAWTDRFWECGRCRKVFWHGTHWRRIAVRLRRAGGVDR